MPGNSFGQAFRISSFGESHGGAVGVVIDGCPPGHGISLVKIQEFLDRRKPGQSEFSSPRREADQLECLSGLENGVSLGTPLTLIVRNQDAKPEHYQSLNQAFRPSHADYTTWVKYGLRPASGGGRASARESIARVAAAAVAEQVLAAWYPDLRVVAYVDSVKDIYASVADPQLLERATVEAHPLRCPDSIAREAMAALILQAKAAGDSVGGCIRCVCSGVPVGLGEPVFDKLEADLAKAMLSLPASKGFELGLGFAATQLFGSEHNDAFCLEGGQIRTQTNHSGGIQGGISNGELITLRVAFKPVASIFKSQHTVNEKGEALTTKLQGRHDPCVLPRAVPLVEAMALLVLMDHALRQKLVLAARTLPPSSRREAASSRGEAEGS